MLKFEKCRNFEMSKFEIEQKNEKQKKEENEKRKKKRKTENKTKSGLTWAGPAHAGGGRHLVKFRPGRRIGFAIPAARLAPHGS